MLLHKEPILDNSKLSSKKVSPNQYEKALQGVELESLVLDECSAKLKREKLLSSASLNVLVSDEQALKDQSEQRFIIEQKYKLIVKPSGERTHVLQVTATFILTYTLSSKVPRDFLKIFSEGNVHLNSWPYFRELVQNLTQRMGIRPLTVPLLK